MASRRVDLPGFFNFNCECFRNGDPIFSHLSFPTKNSRYVAQEKKRSIAYFEEVNRHQFFDFEAPLKPCYGISTIHAYQLLHSYQRHNKTNNRLRLHLKKQYISPNQTYIRFQDAGTISVVRYAQTVKQNLRAKINTICNFYDYWTPVSVQLFQDSETFHQKTLTVFENVLLESSQDGTNQLEVSFDSPI